MSEDEYGDDIFNSAFLNEVQAIEVGLGVQATSTSTAKQAKSPARRERPNLKQPSVISIGSDDFDMTFNFSESELAVVEQTATTAQRPPVAGPSRLTRQTTLTGEILPTSNQPKPSTQRKLNRTTSAPLNKQLGKQPVRTKKWDHTEFAKTGLRKSRSAKEKGKQKALDSDAEEDEEDEERFMFEQFPAPYEYGEPPPMKVKPDLLACQNWIFPINKPRRDYQFNIIKKCLYQNTLVALPTGLGKTFIAGVVMKNYHDWFPDGKICFLAPTKPLVQQQFDAFHDDICLPRRNAAVLTGGVQSTRRLMAWAEKRILFLTPQTLINDLLQKSCDPLDIVLIVIDEAHRGTGDYAYAQVVRYMMAHNPHFRVLALTATPGSTPEAVQSVVDSLHVSHIEIRDENSFDIRPYKQKKNIKIHEILMSEPILRVREALAKVMWTIAKRLIDLGILYCHDVIKLQPFACLHASKSLRARPDARQLQWTIGPLMTLRDLAQAMGYLMEFSISMCYGVLKSISEKEKQSKNSKKKLSSDPDFIEMMNQFDRQQAEGFAIHPKMEKLVALLLDHFVQAANEEASSLPPGQEGTNDGGSKIMVFVSFRGCVEEVVALLNQHRPMIRATAFIGQGTDKAGRKGITQAEQLQVLRRFKAGEFNTLVATSIGEEGLDIGEIDRIICYDSQKTPLRMLQRVGRTGRKREGNVDVLQAEGRESPNWAKSMESYEDVQRSIVRGDQLELFDDVERLIPDHIKPQCLQVVLEAEPEPSDSEADKPKRKGPAPKRKKRDDDIYRNIPETAHAGFVSVKDLLMKRPKSQKAKASKKLGPLNMAAIEDNASDVDIENGPTATPTKKQALKTKQARNTSRKKTSTAEIDPLAIENRASDEEIENGPLAEPVKRKRTSKVSSSKPSKRRKRSSEVDDVEDKHDTDVDEHNSPVDSPGFPDEENAVPTWKDGNRDSFNVDVVPDLETLARASMLHSDCYSLSASPEKQIHTSSPTKLSQCSEGKAHTGIHSSPPPESSCVREVATQTSVHSSWLLEDMDVSDTEIALPPPQGTSKHYFKEVKQSTPKRPILSPFNDNGVTRAQTSVFKSPSSLRKRTPVALSSNSPDHPDSIRPREKPSRVRKRLLIESSPVTSATPSPRFKKRIHRKDEGATSNERRRRQNEFFIRNMDMEAAHSGDEISEGGSGVDLEERSSDQEFLQPLAETQMGDDYNQDYAYRLGLCTQVPAGVDGPQFASGPNRRGRFAGGRAPAPRASIAPNTLTRNTNTSDDYEFGTFIVRDSDPLVLESEVSSDF